MSLIIVHRSIDQELVTTNRWSVKLPNNTKYPNFKLNARQSEQEQLVNATLTSALM